MIRRALAVTLGVLGCGPNAESLPSSAAPAALSPTARDATLRERAPESYTSLALPDAAGTLFAAVGPDGHGVIADAQGRFFAVDAYGAVTAVPALPQATGRSVRGAVERASGELLALTDDGALGALGGWVQTVPLPAFLRAARARISLGDSAIWATPTGLFASVGDTWLRLDRSGAAVTDITALLPLGGDGDVLDLWALRADGALLRVRRRGEAVTWSDALPGVPGPVRAIALHGDHRYISRDEDLLRVTQGGALERVRIPGKVRGPSVMVSAGAWLWLVWTDEVEAAVARWDGDGVVEVLGRGGPLRAPRLAVDSARGDIALLTDGASATHLVAEATVRTTGLTDGATVTSPSLRLRVEPPAPWRVEGVDIALDGTRVASDDAAPFSWSESGARTFADLAFGDHVLTLTTRYRGAAATRTAIRFRYASPLGRAVTYASDVAPIYRTHCARCHSTGVARDLDGYERLRAQSVAALDALTARRMPPDFSIDSTTLRVFTAWIGSGLPRE